MHSWVALDAKLTKVTLNGVFQPGARVGMGEQWTARCNENDNDLAGRLAISRIKRYLLPVRGFFKICMK